MSLLLATILIVDDHSPTLQQWEQSLKARRFNPLVAVDGETALAIAQAQQPDLILSDLEMPQMDGFELLTQLKRSTATRHIPVLICSSSTNPLSEYLARTLGAIGYYRKPLSVESLTQKVFAELGLVSAVV